MTRLGHEAVSAREDGCRKRGVKFDVITCDCFHDNRCNKPSMECDEAIGKLELVSTIGFNGKC